MDVVVTDEVTDLDHLTALERADEHDKAFVIWDMGDDRVSIGVQDVVDIQVMPVSARSDNRLMPHVLQDNLLALASAS